MARMKVLLKHFIWCFSTVSFFFFKRSIEYYNLWYFVSYSYFILVLILRMSCKISFFRLETVLMCKVLSEWHREISLRRDPLHPKPLVIIGIVIRFIIWIVITVMCTIASITINYFTSIASNFMCNILIGAYANTLNYISIANSYRSLFNSDFVITSLLYSISVLWVSFAKEFNKIMLLFILYFYFFEVLLPRELVLDLALFKFSVLLSVFECSLVEDKLLLVYSSLDLLIQRFRFKQIMSDIYVGHFLWINCTSFFSYALLVMHNHSSY